ncbi:hypothetical protein KFZ58_16965 [Virgibacillus sp. NKC19-16]|uniref:hypothetical protein n=1 Tax=Virgibacillus salidurans TaxID=2831673 RepID=UPI001F4392C9|nr:hypothetical protein [Virgibacillus sp. NKC19-16]UJL46032.1 hypothetical protein KFZ58_16965 [Virgibacillus sp. NKC19-16]
MIKENVIEFLFNENKYKVEKFVIMIWFWLAVLYLATAFRVSLTVLFASVLMLFLATSLIKIMWYNKKKNIQTLVIDWIGILFMAFVLIACFYVDL